MKLIDAKEMKLVFAQSMFEKLLVEITLRQDAVTFLRLLKVQDKVIKKIQND